MTVEIPEHIQNDRYWQPVIYLFTKNDKLNSYFTTEYFDFDTRTIEMPKLRAKSKYWSQAERFMLSLALHLFNERNKINLGDMDYLDANNIELAIDAIRMRFR